MGYYSTLEGRIAIDPPLPWSVVAESDYVGDLGALRGVWFELDVKSRWEGDDEIVTRRAVAIVGPEERRKHYELENHLREIAELIGPDRDAVGWLVREGEEQGDIARYGIRRGKLVVEKADVRWPDGSPVY
jgi:hypothetical protein